jgi:hypothetical protein
MGKLDLRLAHEKMGAPAISDSHLNSQMLI